MIIEQSNIENERILNFMKKLFYASAATILAVATLSLTSSTHADEMTSEFKRASSIQHFYRAVSITFFKDYRDVEKEEVAKKKAEEIAAKQAEEKKAEEKKAAEEVAKKKAEEKKAAEEVAKKKAEDEKKSEEAKKANEESSKQTETYQPQIEEVSYSAAQFSTERLYSLPEFMFSGVVYWNGYKFTYYSQSVLPGGGLSIPGRHVNADGYVSDGDGYIVLAGSAPLGTVYDTPFGYKGKIYDRGTSGNHLDVYIR